MPSFLSSFAIASLLVLPYHDNPSDQKPVWRIDLQAMGYGQGDLATVAFCGSVLVIHPDRSGSKLLFDTATHQSISGQRSSATAPLCEDSALPRASSDNGQGHIIARWKDMSIRQVCDVESCSEPPGKPAVRDVKYYLQKPNNRTVLLFHTHCLGTYPQFIGDDYILFFRCDLKSVVINSDGEQVYRLPAFAFPYVTVNRGGTRFAVLERDESFFHELTGTTDRARLSVFQSSNGKRLFALAWHDHGESTGDGRLALSNEGVQLAVVRSGEVLVFALPS